MLLYELCSKWKTVFVAFDDHGRKRSIRLLQPHQLFRIAAILWQDIRVTRNFTQISRQPLVAVPIRSLPSSELARLSCPYTLNTSKKPLIYVVSV